MIRGDASELYALANDLTQIGAKSVPAARAGIQDAGKTLEEQWRANAEATSGEHGKHYPNSIDSEMAFSVTSVAVDVGPNSAKPQGSMGRGFEYGSVNQPPHLDGERALSAVERRVEALIDAALGRLF